MSIADLIQNASSKNALDFENTFNSIMSDKMTGAIEAKYDQMFSSAVDNDGEEELQPDLETETQDEE